MQHSEVVQRLHCIFSGNAVSVALVTFYYAFLFHQEYLATFNHDIGFPGMQK